MDIAAWLRELGLERYEEAFRENDIAPAVLPELMDQDLKDLDVSLGHRRLLLKAIRALADDQAGHSPLNAHLLRLRRPSPRCDRSPSGGNWRRGSAPRTWARSWVLTSAPPLSRPSWQNHR